MTDVADKVVFARTRYHYDSYIDFWRLVELSGFPTCFVDEIDLPQDKIYITTPINGEIGPHVRHRRSILQGPQRAKIAWWNIERHDAPGSPRFADVVSNALTVIDAVWVGDRHFASLDDRLRHVCLNSHPGLRLSEQQATTRYDYAHISYVHSRRKDIFDRLRAEGLKEAPPGGWGEQRDRALNSSRVMVNVHQTPAPIGEPLRFAVAAAYQLPILTETLADYAPLAPGVHFAHAGYQDLVPAIRGALLDDKWNSFKELGENLYREICVARPFASCVLEAVQRQFG